MTRNDLRHQGETMLRTLFGSTAQPAGLANLLTEAAYGGIWTRPGLALRDRLICSIAALGVGPRLKALRRHLGAGLEHGLTAEAIREILVQASLYSGFSAAEETLTLAGEVFAERGIQFPADPPENVSLEELDQRGAAFMTTLHGSRATQGYASPDNPVTGQLYPAAIRYGYGEIWSRPGLEPRERALVAIAALHRTAPAGAGGEIRAVGAECRADADPGDRGDHPDGAADRVPAGVERAGRHQCGILRVTRIVYGSLRLGVLVPSGNSVAETELRAMLPDEVTMLTTTAGVAGQFRGGTAGDAD